MKLLLLSYIFVFGYNIHFCNASCNPTENSNVLERAFGPVITAKLEDTCEDIKASFQSGLTEQNAQTIEILDVKTKEIQQIFNTKIDEQREGNKSRVLHSKKSRKNSWNFVYVKAT